LDDLNGKQAMISNASKKSDFQTLDERTLDPDPIKQFGMWYSVATGKRAGRWRRVGIALYNLWRALLGRAPEDVDAMAVATATKEGKVSARMMLLKNVDSNGFIFYTNYNSAKGRDFTENPAASLVFYWPELGRQVRVEGSVEKLSAGESDAYFRTRPRASQLGAHASDQSSVLKSRDELERRYEELREKFEGRPVPRPPHWGGYRLKPTRIEFWQARFARLNDRIVYERQKDGSWTMKRLAP
jgi:pyridoxamine 5'-phosphate oxidase